MPAKLDLFVIAGLTAGTMLMIETHHRMELIAPAEAAPVVQPALASEAPGPEICASADMRFAVSRMAYSAAYSDAVQQRLRESAALPDCP